MQDERASRLRSLDASSRAFTDGARYPVVAARDLGRLRTLSKQVINDVTGWGDRLEAIDCAAAFNLDRAILLVLESVFDEILAPDALRVMEAEISLGRAGHLD